MDHPFLKSPSGDNPVIIEAEFKATVSRLFQAWTREEDFVRWFGPANDSSRAARLDLTVGGNWEFSFKNKDGTMDKLFGNYLAIEQNTQLVLSWSHARINTEGESETSAESILTIVFESRGTGSFMRLVHESISTESARINVGGGWSASIAQIKVLIE